MSDIPGIFIPSFAGSRRAQPEIRLPLRPPGGCRTPLRDPRTQRCRAAHVSPGGELWMACVPRRRGLAGDEESLSINAVEV